MMNKISRFIVEKALPIHKSEIAKFLCISMMMILVVYVHSVLRISKDALVISHLGTETISAIKVWAVLPVSLLFMVLYIKLSDFFNRSQLFHLMCWFFLSYFVLFALVLYPHREFFLIDISEAVYLKLPALKYLFKIVSGWHYTIFYVFSESWVAIMLSITFWQIANHICSIEESKRFYPLLGLAAQFGLMIAAILSRTFVAEGANWQPTLNHVTVSIVLAGILLSLCMVFLGKIIGIEFLNKKTGQLTTSKGKNKVKISLTDSFKYILSSMPVLLITSLLLCYNISINLVEGIWKKAVEVFFSNSANQIHLFMSNVNVFISILSIACAFVGVYILRVCKWRTSALITPVVALVSGGAFFLFMLLKDSSAALAMSTSVSALSIAVYFGATYVIFSRSTKHTLFDSTKEMVYIPLDDDLKTKGKAAAETVGMRFGKGSGAFIQQILLTALPSMTLLDLAPIVSGIFLVVLIGWIISTVVLGKRL